MKLVAVVTALNEAETIGPLVSALSERFEVIVIDDGSTDDTGTWAKIAGAQVITHDKPHGIGPSLMEAWKVALVMDADRMLQIDAGGSHEPLEAFQFLNVDADLVVGSRFHPEAIYNGGMRKHLSRFYSILCNWAMGGFVTSDWTSGYRLFSKRALKVLTSGSAPAFWTSGHTWQAEVVHRCIRRILSVKEVPITYTAGRSSLRLSQLDDAIFVLLKVMFL